MRFAYFSLAALLALILWGAEVWLFDIEAMDIRIIVAVSAIGRAIPMAAIAELVVVYRRRKPWADYRPRRVLFNPWPGDVAVLLRILFTVTFFVMVMLGFFLEGFEAHRSVLLAAGLTGFAVQIAWGVLEWIERRKGWESRFHEAWTPYNY